MSEQRSYVKYEKEVTPEFRDRLSHAESEEDVKKFFTYSGQALLEKIMGQDAEIEYRDVQLTPQDTADVKWLFSEKLAGNTNFQNAWHNSDLEKIFDRMASDAIKRIQQLQKTQEQRQRNVHSGGAHRG